MTIQEIYELAVKLGIQNDLRGQARVKQILKKAKDRYEKLRDKEKTRFDKERLWNPYSDTRVFVDPKKEIKKVMAGIDIQPAEIIMAKEMGVDLVIAHHPVGSALADLGDVMHLQADVLAMYGVPINIAESLTKERISEVARGVAPSNHYRPVQAAELYGIGLMCTHTVTDNMVATFLDKYLKKAKPELVGDVLDALEEIAEYQKAIEHKTGPRLFTGQRENSIGKMVLTEITGGTEGAVGMYEKMAQAGIGTIVGMHMDESRKNEAQKNHLNVVIAGHMSSDSLGMNLFLDELEKKGIEIIPVSGLIRVSRVKKAARPESRASKRKISGKKRR
ncbi:Nif3-like dinuclear metal center hexameric protein [Candidatus Falkowbacteria bacterium]|nr:Nif3-like dinuclear metal center hexameric protein [Candidatus Falkowbacteria bacterium]